MVNKSNNSVNVIHPYKTKQGVWMYDDNELGIYSEVFVMGTKEVIEHLIGKRRKKFTAYISSLKIPEYTAKLNKIEDREDGWYKLDGTEMEHWLCGRTLDYFPDYPNNIYVKIEV